MLLVGSQALHLNCPELLSRTPQDIDLVATLSEAQDLVEASGATEDDILLDTKGAMAFRHKGRIIDISLARDGNTNCELLDLTSRCRTTKKGMKLPDLDMLFALKTSHRYKKDSPHFWKTLLDWHKMRAVGAKVPDGWEGFLKRRERETYQRKAPKLVKTSKKDFFSTDHGVQYTYDHDSIHEAIKLQEKPAYRYFQKDNEEVECSKEKFLSCPREIQINSFIEESGVLAIERSLVPHPGKMTPKDAWTFALSKVLSSISSGWWRQWGYENVFDILKIAKYDHWERFQEGLKSGIVKPFDAEAPSNPYK